MKIISNTEISKKKLVLLEVTSIVLYLNVLFFSSNSIYLNIFYFICIFYVLYKNKFIIPLLNFIFAYYSQIAIMTIFTSYLYLYKGVIMIYKPIGFFYILISPLLLIVIELITRSIKSLILLKKYRYKVRVEIKNKIYNLSAYFDSGNTLKFKDLPVIFLTDELKEKNLEYEKFLVDGIGK